MKTLAAVLLLSALTPPMFAQSPNAELADAAESAHALAKSARADAHRKTYDLGKIFVIEKDDAEDPGARLPMAGYIDGASVLTATKEKKEEYEALLKAAAIRPGVPLRWSVPSVNEADVKTLDDYFLGMAAAQAKDKAAYEKANPGKKYPFSGDNSTLRRELEGALKGHDAVVLRYIHVKRAGEK